MSSPEQEQASATHTPPAVSPGAKKKSGFRRFLRYFYLRFIRLRGTPHSLALGMAFGIFTGSMPILPFQIVTAVALAMIFKGSKVAAALGTWISNPANWYFLYYYSYKIGARILGLSPSGEVFTSIMTSVRQQEDGMIILGKIVGAGGSMMAAFLVGGLVLGFAIGTPSYFIFLKVFSAMERWRARKGRARRWRQAGM